MERSRFMVPQKSLDQGRNRKSGEENSDLRKQPKVESIIMPGD